MAVFVSPGPEGFPTLTTRSPSGGRQKFTVPELRAGAGQAFRPRGTTSRTVVQIRGMRAVIWDLAATQAVLNEIIPSVVRHTGDWLTFRAKQEAPVSNWDTNKGPATYYPGALRDSISFNMWTEGRRIGFDSGPTVYYAPFVHFGTATGIMPNQFMFRASDEVEPPFRDAMDQIGKIPDGLRHLSPPYGQVGNTTINKYRQYLYSVEKSFGDLSAIGLSPLLSGPRAVLLNTARGLGDVNAAMEGAVFQRVRYRLEGRATGRLIGLGRVPFQGGGDFSSFIGGRVGARIYQRTVSRYVNVRY